MLRILLLILFSLTTQAQDLYPFERKAEKETFQLLLSELRCMVCQNQNLVDSNAPLAKDLRDEVYQLVKSGKTEPEIINLLTRRYGDFVVFQPKVKPSTYALWFGPFILLIIGCGVIWRVIYS